MLKMITPAQARAITLENCNRMTTEVREVSSALGYVVTDDILATEDHPRFNRAMMDGYAVRMSDSGDKVKVIGEVFAGTASELEVGEGQCLEIMTGAPCPDWCEAVVPYEKAEADGQFVSLPQIAKLMDNIAVAGKEMQAAEIVLPANNVLSELGIAALISQGITKLKVCSRPTLAFIATGAELSDDSSASGSIRDSNSPMIDALLKEAGIADISLHRAGDSKQSLRDSLAAALQQDVVILSGGVSMGKKDLVPETLAELGVELLFHKVSQKPGKPLLFGMYGKKPVFALPGNPLAVHNCFHQYIGPCLRKMSGLSTAYQRGTATLTTDISVRGNRTVFQLAKVNGAGEELQITPLVGKGSADVYAPVSANAYLIIDVANQNLKAGSKIEFEWTRSGQWQI
jgi:molybdopterin molybdotransferase